MTLLALSRMIGNGLALQGPRQRFRVDKALRRAREPHRNVGTGEAAQRYRYLISTFSSLVWSRGASHNLLRNVVPAITLTVCVAAPVMC